MNINITEDILKGIANQFQLEGTIINVTPYGEGHINTTYLITCDKKRYIMQKINTTLFSTTDKLMNNIMLVTEHIRKEYPNETTLTLVYTLDGKSYLDCEYGSYRVYDFIENSVCLQLVSNPNEFYQSAITFGKFLNMLDTFDASCLYEILPNFHNTPKRFEVLIDAIKNDKCKRLESVLEEVEFALAHKDITNIITELISKGEMRVKVTHNDTKLNNSLLEADTYNALAVIDLDTIMPGSICYDFGDSIRFGCNSSKEDETDLDKVYFKMEYFEAYVKGFLSSLSSITEVEKDHLVTGAILMTYECGIRFLTDYLNGDTYFKIHREHHNLDRCRTQFKLVMDMELQIDEMQKIVDKYYKIYKNKGE